MSSNAGIIRHWPSAAGWTLAVAVVALPWAFGGVAPFALLVVPVGFFALLAAVVGHWRDPHRIGRALRLSPWSVAALGGLGVLGFLQAASWPRGLVAAVSPLRARLGQQAAEALGSEAGSLPWSLSPASSVTAALLLLGLAAIYLATLLVARDRIDRRLILGSVLAVAVAQVVFGAPRWMARASTLWGLTLPGDDTRLRGSYVNANHMALLLEIGLVLAFAWVAWCVRRGTLELSLERRLLALAAPAGLWLVLFAGLAFTESRAGLVAALAATGVQALCLGGRRGRRWLVPVVVAAGLGLALGVTLWLGGGAGFDRLTGTSVYDLTWNARLAVYRSTIDLFGRFPWFGSGLGSFRDAFPLVQPAGVAGGWTHAHNDFLELAATAGVAGLVLMASGLVATLRRLRRVLAEGRRTEDRLGAVAALGALTAAGVHECLDFGLTIPANALALVVVVAAASAARRTYSTSSTAPGNPPSPGTGTTVRR